jgi:hypothetical protein
MQPMRNSIMDYGASLFLLLGGGRGGGGLLKAKSYQVIDPRLHTYFVITSCSQFFDFVISYNTLVPSF